MNNHPPRRRLGHMLKFRAMTHGDGLREPLAARRRLHAVWRVLPALLFAVACGVGALSYGWFAAERGWFPDALLNDGLKTLRGTSPPSLVRGVVGLGGVHEDDATSTRTRRPSRLRRQVVGLGRVHEDDAAAHRIRFLNGASRLAGPVLWASHGWFLDLCPDTGCVAVAYNADGTVRHAYPWRVRQVEQAWRASATAADHPFEFSPSHFLATDDKIAPSLVLGYPDGDVLVTLWQFHSHPYPAGVARLDKDGRPRWVRRDYSHHIGQLDRAGNVMMPALRVWRPGGAADVVVPTLLRERAYWSLVYFIDRDGRLSGSMDLMAGLLRSPFRAVVEHSDDAADALHLNYVHRLGADAGGAWGIAPGDIVASLRNISAFGVFDGATGALKRLVRGSFFRQHSVTHYRDAKFLMLDNHGGDGAFGPSRVLMVDLADGRETTVFPNDDTPKHLRGLFSSLRGHVDISPDRSRALAVFTQAGVAVEIGLPGGEALAVFHSLHDASNKTGFSSQDNEALRIFLLGLVYLRDPAELPEPMLM